MNAFFPPDPVGAIPVFRCVPPRTANLKSVRKLRKFHAPGLLTLRTQREVRGSQRHGPAAQRNADQSRSKIWRLVEVRENFGPRKEERVIPPSAALSIPSAHSALRRSRRHLFAALPGCAALKFRTALLCLFSLVCALIPARAVENVSNGTFNETAPTNSDISGWTTGWGNGSVTGWDYVGLVDGVYGPASGVYLGNGWVLTAGHVGAGPLTLGGTTYSVAGAGQSITNAGGLADLSLFQINGAPSLPALTIASLSPVPNGSYVAMLGYGGNGGRSTAETWGYNLVTEADVYPTTLGPDYPFTSTDFETDYGSQPPGVGTFTNNYELVLGDSGGGDFIYNSVTGEWELAGVNEAIDTSNDSYMVQFPPQRAG